MMMVTVVVVVVVVHLPEPVSSNSPWKFVNAGMEHMLGPEWTDLFDFIGVSASKPLFYTGTRPFRLVSTVPSTLAILIFAPVSVAVAVAAVAFFVRSW